MKKNFMMMLVDEAFKVECILKENQSHYKAHWLGYDMTHNNWGKKNRN